jgi:hypothetical protein
MRDAIHVAQGSSRKRTIADVALVELDEVDDVGPEATMHLVLEAVEHDDVVATFEQPPHEVRTDEAGSAGNESPHAAHYARKAIGPQVATTDCSQRNYGTEHVRDLWGGAGGGCAA